MSGSRLVQLAGRGRGDGRGGQASGPSEREVVLVDLYWTRDKDPRVPLGHASLLAELARAGVRAQSVVQPVQGADVDALAASLQRRCEARAAGDLDLGIGVYVWNEDLVVPLLRQLRARGVRNRIILGGPQISYAGAELERLYPEADVFVRGQGEQALVQLVTTRGRGRIAGVHHAGEVDELAQTSAELDGLVSPWLAGVVPLAAQRFVRWETQRGCPYRCSFCQHRDADGSVRHRPLSAARIAAEVDLFCEAGVAEIAVLDPIFNVAAHAVDVLERFAARGFRGRLALQCRSELVTPAFLDAAQSLNVCLELGLQTIHAAEGKALGRGNRLDLVDRALAEIRERRIDHEVSLIFGLPAQTLASFIESVRWCLERRVPRLKAFPLLLLRGTELARTRERWGFEDDGRPTAMVQASRTFTHEEWQTMNRVSSALQSTEGNHPTTIEELLRIADTMTAGAERWHP